MMSPLSVGDDGDGGGEDAKPIITAVSQVSRSYSELSCNL